MKNRPETNTQILHQTKIERPVGSFRVATDRRTVSIAQSVLGAYFSPWGFWVVSRVGFSSLDPVEISPNSAYGENGRFRGSNRARDTRARDPRYTRAKGDFNPQV